MKSFFAAAILFAAVYAAEETTEEHEDHDHEEHAEEVGPVKTAWAAPVAEKSLNALSGEYWTVAGMEGAHTLYVSINGSTDETQGYDVRGWLYNYFAIQRPALQPTDAAARMLAEEEEVAEEVATDSVWDAFTCGQKFTAADGAEAIVADAADRAAYFAVWAADKDFDATTLKSTDYIKEFTADGVKEGSWALDGEPTQKRVGKVYSTSETIMRPFGGNADTFAFKGNETLKVRVGSKGFSSSKYYDWRANDFAIVVLDSATTLAAGAVAIAATLAF